MMQSLVRQDKTEDVSHVNKWVYLKFELDPECTGCIQLTATTFSYWFQCEV